MKNKLNKNQWVAIIVSVGVAIFVIFFSFQNSPYFKSPASALLPTASFENTNKIINTTMDANYENTADLIIEEISEGTGRMAETGNTISVNYEGFLTDGSKFDSSLERGVPFEFILGTGSVIEGWDKGISGMKEGGVRKLVIPSNLAYGENEVGPIPPNSTLIFVVELIEVLD